MEAEIKQLNREIDTLTNISHELNEQIVLGRGIYLLNTREKLCYVFDAINEQINRLTDEVETLSEENENIADNILDLFDKMEEIKHD